MLIHFAVSLLLTHLVLLNRLMADMPYMSQTMAAEECPIVVL